MKFRAPLENPGLGREIFETGANGARGALAPRTGGGLRFSPGEPLLKKDASGCLRWTMPGRVGGEALSCTPENIVQIAVIGVVSVDFARI